MKKNTTGTRRGKVGAVLLSALMIVLAMTLLVMSLLTGCAKDPKPEDTTVPSTAAPTVPTTAAPEPTLPPETLPAEPVSTEPAETEPPVVTVPADWTPSLNKTDISFFGVGETYILTVPGAPGGLEILWSAENEEIAAVDETGRVTAVGPGSARIFAEVAETKLECWIRCKFDAPPAEDEPSLNNTDISFFGVGESYRLKVSNVPDDAKIVWSSEDYGVASVDGNGRVRAVGPGTIRVWARVGDTLLSCWVRCHFTAPEVPRSSVADGSWRVTLHKSSVTVQNEETGVLVAQAELLSRVQVEKEDLEELEPYDKLDLTRFGLGTFRVSTVAFSADETTCTVTAGDAVLLFKLEDNGLWTLVDADGEARYYTSGTGRFVFTDSSKVYEQTGGASGPMNRCADVLALFDLHDGYEETVTPLTLTVSDGLVTNAVWHYGP